MDGSLVLAAVVQSLGVGREVIDGPVGECEGLVGPKESSVIELLGAVVLDQRACLGQKRHGLQRSMWAETVGGKLGCMILTVS